MLLHPADIPRPVPATTFPMLGGGVIDFSKYRGKVLAVEFLSTTCPHCQKCSAILQKMYQEYGPKGFQPIGIATNEMAHMLIPDYVKKLNLTFPVGFAQHTVAVEFLQHPPMLTFYVPHLVFIDRKGVIRAQYPGSDKFYENEEANIRKEIEALLKESAAAPAKPAAKKVTKKAA
jgi:peroxiredoxin